MRHQLAIKVLHPELEGFPELVTRFQREAVAGAHIIHPNVASASDFGKFDGESYFLVLEYIRGATLSDVMKKGPLPPQRAAKIARQMAAALGAAHAKGIVHRDVKPRNVMLVQGEDDLVKLIDFGLARVPVSQLTPVSQDEDISRRSLTAAGVVMGTVAYMAPETALGMKAVEPRSDLYAVGVILYELLAGKHPFDAVDPALLFAQHRNEPPPPLRLRNPSVVVPDVLEAVVRKLLEKDPEQRYPNAAAVIAALEDAMPPTYARDTPLSNATDLPITVLGMRAPSVPDVEVAPATSNAQATAKRPTYTPRLLGRPGSADEPQSSGKWRIVAGVLGIAVVGLLVVLLTGQGPSETSPSPHSSIAVPTAPQMATGARAPGGGAVGASAPTPTAAAADARDDSVTLRRKLKAAAGSKDVAAGTGALLHLAEGDPSAFRDPDVQRTAAIIAEAAGTAGGDDADRIFFVLSSKLGSDGLDVLYDVFATGGTSRGGSRAAAVLSRPQTIERATPAMRIAFDLRRAACQHRPYLFPRAGQEGDARALTLLESMQPPQCIPGTGACCWRRHGDLDKAIAALKQRSPE
jgi:serine/threonine-protein kinase